MNIVTAILALAKLFTVLDKFLSSLVLEYHRRKVEQNDVEFIAAIDEAYQKQSTKSLQRELGEYLD